MIKDFNGLLFSNAKLINFQMIFKKAENGVWFNIIISIGQGLEDS